MPDEAPVAAAELRTDAAAMNLRGCLDEELKLTRTVVHDHPDFREGVRSVLVDKDGVIVGKNLRGSELVEAVKKALAR